MEIEKESGSAVSFAEPFGLKVKRNFKGEYGWEYSVRGDTIKEIKMNAYEIEKHLFDQGLIPKEPKFPI